jgi:phospholipid/cholesterol/gamma-HCH transport system permease protein
MSTHQAKATFIMNHEAACFDCAGGWSIHLINDVLITLEQAPLPSSDVVTIDGKEITQFDSAGALALLKYQYRLKHHHKTVNLVNFADKQLALMRLVESKHANIDYNPPAPVRHDFLYFLGRETVSKLHQMDGLIVLIGKLCDKLIAAAGSLKRFQVPSLISNIYTTGLQALPIIALLSFLIGIVLAYQMGLQLETYGANGFIAYLSGMACFREFAPLITAIIVAGRTSSSFTAQIGSMKINEEIDALETMGLSPVELLVMPKLLGLLIIFPLLIFWADLFSILGSMYMSKIKLSIGYIDFLTRLQDSVGAKQLLLGLYKAPVFAILIALVGCFQGFNVAANASSIGSQTTKSVVQALFLIIIADAVYSIIYSWMRL